MENYINSKHARKLLDITSQTLRNWDKENKIETIRTPSNTRMYSLKSVYKILNFTPPDESKKYIYSRVSSAKQKDDLKRQEDLLKSKYPNYTLVSDVGSGINWKRKGLKTILEQTMRGNVKEVVVAHRDRLCRFAFELIEWIITSNGAKLVVLDTEENKSDNTELADDIMSIIHIFSCRQMGKRKYKNKSTIEKKKTDNIIKKTENN